MPDGAAFLVDRAKYLKALSYLAAMAQAGPATVARELSLMAVAWQGEVKRHMPVDTSLAKQSVVADPAERNGDVIRAQTGSNIPYVPTLEFGVAGWPGLFGEVFEWRPDDPPILDWAAKRGDATKNTTFSMDDEGRGHNLKGEYTTAGSANNAEFAPPFRASWELIAPKLTERLRNRLAKLIASGRVDPA